MNSFARLIVATCFIACTPAFAANNVGAVKPARAPVVTIGEIAVNDETLAPGDTVTYSISITADQTTRPGVIVFFVMNEKDRIIDQSIVAFGKIEANKPFIASRQAKIGKNYADGNYTIRASTYGSNFNFWKLKPNAFRVSRVVDAACGGSHGGSFVATPTADLCATGQAGTVIAQGGDFLWSCANALGVAASCKAIKATPTDSVCGSANGTIRATVPAADGELCAVGKASAVKTDPAGIFHWICVSANGGLDRDCAAAKPQPVTYGWLAGAFGDYGACVGGKQAHTRIVRCLGSDKSVAADALCNGNKPAMEEVRSCVTPVNGQCGAVAAETDSIKVGPGSSPYGCASGQLSNLVVGTDIATWTCMGLNGGADATCKRAIEGTPQVPANKPIVVDDGDSISIFWAGNHTGIYAKAHAGVDYRGFASGGAGIADLDARVQKVLDAKPTVFTVLIGANDLTATYAYPTTQDWVNALFAYTDRIRATGAKVAVSTILPQAISTTPHMVSNTIIHNVKRIEANSAIRAALADHRIDAVIDYAADPVMGPDAAATDVNLYSDGQHPTDGTSGTGNGQGELAVIYTKAVDVLIGAAGTVTPPTTPTPGLTNGVCGAADKQSANVAPNTYLCSVGTASLVGGTGPWNWTCTGTSGAIATCSAPASADGYTWKYGEFGDFSICTNDRKIRSREVWCAAPSGAHVTDNNCANSGVKPDVFYVDVCTNSVELPIIPSNFDVNSELVPSWGTGDIPGVEPGNVEGAFRFNCNPGHIASDDPIVYPGQPGKSHLHQFFGNTEANANSTYASLRSSGMSTCNSPLNRSAYWIPAMLNGKGKVVRPDYVNIYYKRPPADSGVCKEPWSKGCVDLPRGLRFVFGYNMATNERGTNYFNCDGPTARSDHYDNMVDAGKNCPAGNKLGAVLSAPPCWNGKDLDSPDHRSHMAYPQQDGYGHNLCPATHPYIIPTFTLGAWYTVDDDLDRTGTWNGAKNTWHLSSDDMPGMGMMKPGSTLHADWFGAWDDTTLKMWTDNCINKGLSCSGGDLGNGKQLKMFSGFSWSANPRLVDVPGADAAAAAAAAAAATSVMAMPAGHEM